MGQIDYSKYPKVQELIQECNLEKDQDHIIWLQFRKSEAAVLIAEMHQLCKAGLSRSITLRKRSEIGANFYYGRSGSLHVFAKEQAREELELSYQDVSDLFRHRGVHRLFNRNIKKSRK
ncbi:hypothetical protein [Marinicrinis lubricantis]|uniref:Uncharacterized protein n=1 Tax=Marinicrinis lubricantis TaxID=2086470 RepID=A0ABW1IN40_9BACL